MNLPIEIIKMILFHLPIIIDKRNFIRSSKYLNQFYPLMKNIESEFVELLNATKFVDTKLLKFNQSELYALEYIYYDRENIPNKYLNQNENLLTKYSLLYFNMAMNQTNVCKKIYNKYKIFTNSIINGAASVGNLKMIKWIRKHKNNKYNGFYTNMCKFAALNGHLEVLKWSREIKCGRTDDTCKSAALNGHLEILKWAHENACPWNSDTCSNAALNGHLEVLKWARENGCPWNSDTCSNAALNGHLEVLKWARENSCPWTRDTCDNAALNGHLEVLKWARENHCPWNYVLTYRSAALNGNLEVIKWMIEMDARHRVVQVYNFKI